MPRSAFLLSGTAVLALLSLPAAAATTCADLATMKIAPNAPSPTARRCWPLNFLAVTCVVVSDVSVARMSGAEAIGLPHLGQEAARFDTSFPHSTHLTSATSVPPVEPGPAKVLVDGSAGVLQGRKSVRQFRPLPR